MTKKLTENELTSYLEVLKNILQNFDYSSIPNIIFLNMESFYSYIDNYCSNNSKTIKEIMSAIEPCIPLTLCVDDSTLELFIQASTSYSQEDIKKMEELFYKRARIDFMDTIRKANTKDKWDFILQTCQNLRQCLYN